MKGSLPKMILSVLLIIALSAVVVTISFSFFYAMVLNPNSGEAQTPAEPALPQVVELKYDLRERQFNLTDRGHYAKLQIILIYPEIKQRVWFGLREAVDDSIPVALLEHEDRILDLIGTVMRGQSSLNLSTGAGVDQVKADLINRINGILPTRYGIIDILFVDMIVT